MATTFFNVVKANKHIEGLELQVADLTTQLAALPAELEAEFESNAAELTQTKSDLSTAKQTIGSLETAAKLHAAQVARLTADLSERDARLAEVPTQIETLAAAKAVQQVASQGVPPIAIKPAGDPQTTAPAKSKGRTAQERLKEEIASRNPMGLL